MDRIHRLVFEHRRTLAAVSAGLAVLAALGAVRQTHHGVAVVVARRDLPSGHVVTASDLGTAVLAPRARPAHALRRSLAIGRTVAGPMRRGEAMTDFRVLSPGALDGYGAGSVMTSVRVDRTDGLTGLHVGDRVDVVAVDPDGESEARVVARRVEVATLSDPANSPDGAMRLGIVTTEQTALALATAALESRFSVITSG